MAFTVANRLRRIAEVSSVVALWTRALVPYPRYRLGVNLRAGGRGIEAAWYLAAAAGAFAAAYALKDSHRATNARPVVLLIHSGRDRILADGLERSGGRSSARPIAWTDSAGFGKRSPYGVTLSGMIF